MSLKLCENMHEPVVYTDYDHRNRLHKCPLCEALDDLARLRDDYIVGQEELAECKFDRDKLEKECENFQQLLDADGEDR